MKQIKNRDSKKNQMYYFAKYSGLAFEMLGIIVLGTFAGQKLDKLRSSEFPLWTVILSLLSVCIALYLVIKSVIENDPKP